MFREKNPKIQLHLYNISTAEMLLRLRERKLDEALTVLPSRKHLRGLDYIQIASYPLCIALASKHPLSKSKTLKPEQFVEEPFIGYTRKEYPEYEAWVEKLFKQFGTQSGADRRRIRQFFGDRRGGRFRTRSCLDAERSPQRVRARC